MEKVILTPKSVKEFAVLSQKPRITISRAMISFNPAAAAKLVLKTGSFFALIIDNGKLFYQDTADKSYFKINNVTKANSLNAYASGIAPALYMNKIITEPKTARFTIGGFKEGMWELIAIKKNNK